MNRMTTSRTTNHRPRALALAAAAVLGVGSLSGCTGNSSPTAGGSPSPSCPITVSDGWVKAANSGMTAAFGTLTNSSGEPVTVTAASSSSSARTELHEVVDSGGSMVMKPVADGFAVPASGTLLLEPGGYHVMLMDLTGPIKAGKDITITLTCTGGATAQFTAQAKNFSGGDEKYQPGGSESMDSMDSMSPDPTKSSPDPTKSSPEPTKS